VLKALNPLLTAFDELLLLLLLLWLFDELLLELFPLFADEDSVGVCLICEDFVPELPLVVFVVEFVVLLFDDDDVVFELFEVLDVDDELLLEDFELLRFDDDDVDDV
jgi:hypothetical protein